jgi:hypothetical protein
MAPRTVRRRFLPLLFLAGLVVLLLNLYVFLAAGWLDRAATSLVHRLTAGEEVSVGVYGLRSDLFWSTSVDSVVVRGGRGLVVRVVPARIRGSVPSYLLGMGLDSIGAGTLEVALPAPDPDPEPDTLACILEDIRSGLVTSTGVLTLEYGIVHHRGQTVVDSMAIVTSVSRDDGVGLQVESVRAVLPPVGRLTGSGGLAMGKCRALAHGFSVRAAPGSLTVSGELEGEEEELDLVLSGAAGPHVPWLDFPLRLSFSGTAAGPLSSPELRLSVPEAGMAPDGEMTGFSVDTLTVSPDSVRVEGFRASRDGVSLHADGSLRISDLSWTAGAEVSLDRADMSNLVDGLPVTSLSGTVSLDAYGSGTKPGSASLSAFLTAGRAGPVVVNSGTLRGEIGRSSASLRGVLHTPRGSVSLSGDATLGSGMVPISYRGDLSGNLSGSSILDDLSRELPVPVISGISLQTSVEGDRHRLRVDGTVSAASARMDSTSAAEVGFGGRTEIEFSGGVSAAGSLRVGTLTTPGLVLEGIRYSGSFSADVGGDPRAEGLLEVDSVSAGGARVSLSASVGLAAAKVAVKDLELLSPQGYNASADLTARLGDTVDVAMDGITVVRSKQRLISGGRMAGSWWEGGMALDTLWLPTPHGRVAGRGFLGGENDSLDAVLNMDRLDLAAISGLIFPTAGFSGVGSLELSAGGPVGDLRGHLRGRVEGPAWDPYLADSLTVDVTLGDTALTVDGIYSWSEGIRSGIRGGVRIFWKDGARPPTLSDVLWAEVELTEIGDWLFYALPIPVRTRGATVSANAEYSRNTAGEPDFDMQVVATAREMIITAVNQHLPNVSVNILYSYPTTQQYSTRLSLTSGAEGMGKVTAQAMFKVLRHFPSPEIGDYYFRTTLDGYRVVLGSYASLALDGEVGASGESMEERPLLEGDVRIAGGYLGMPPSGKETGGSGGPAVELPFDLLVRISSSRGLWFRSSMADLELTADLVVLTQERELTVNGELNVSRGNVYILQKDFRITEGRVAIQPGLPPTLELDITAETSVRGIMDQSMYTITVRITGPPGSPDMVLSGAGPEGELSQEDILSLLATGLTYGQLQQVDTGALGTGLEDIAQGYIGKLLARSLRDDIGLDAFSLSPELLSDTTSFRFNVGKYILPELFVSYEGDVLSSEPGTVSAQYFISEDVYLQGSTKPTIHGDQEPSLELHYTFSY